jgi:hypothetical protein
MIVDIPSNMQYKDQQRRISTQIRYMTA